jgi:hypothetical protein
MKEWKMKSQVNGSQKQAKQSSLLELVRRNLKRSLPINKGNNSSRSYNHSKISMHQTLVHPISQNKYYQKQMDKSRQNKSDGNHLQQLQSYTET